MYQFLLLTRSQLSNKKAASLILIFDFLPSLLAIFQVLNFFCPPSPLLNSKLPFLNSTRKCLYFFDSTIFQMLGQRLGIFLCFFFLLKFPDLYKVNPLKHCNISYQEDQMLIQECQMLVEEIVGFAETGHDFDFPNETILAMSAPNRTRFWNHKARWKKWATKYCSLLFNI